jgi:hypothetical protein
MSYSEKKMKNFPPAELASWVVFRSHRPSPEDGDFLMNKIYSIVLNVNKVNC